MRSSEPALHSRLLSINKSLAKLRSQASPDEAWTKIPVVCNGDVTGGDAEEAEGEGLEDTWGNFRQICKETGVKSVMIARAAEANPSCFRKEGLEDPIKVVIPRLLKIVSFRNFCSRGTSDRSIRSLVKLLKSM
jgi:tRNA-dihydrouridine synthase 2